MSEMVERVAKAMAKADADNTAWKLYVREARAAIEAMREPTSRMLMASGLGRKSTQKSKWQAMVDEALTSNTAEPA